MKLSDHFTLNEFTYSDTARAQGLDNDNLTYKLWTTEE